MARGFLNWNYVDVVAVLKSHNFFWNDSRGSHRYFIGTVNGKMHQVEVSFHGSKIYKPRTLKSMWLASGLSKKEWGIE